MIRELRILILEEKRLRLDRQRSYWRDALRSPWINLKLAEIELREARVNYALSRLRSH